MATKFAYFAIVPLMSSCYATGYVPDACEIAERPQHYTNSATTIRDIVIVDGHGTPMLVPSAECPRFVYFIIDDKELESAQRNVFGNLITKLNAATVNGKRAGLSGTYTVQVKRQSGSSSWTLSILNTQDLKIVAAQSKADALEKQMGLPPKSTF